MATPAIWLQIGGAHEPMSPEWRLWDAGVRFVGGTHGLGRAKERYSADPPCLNCTCTDAPAIKRMPQTLPDQCWAYYHAELMHRQGGATLAEDLAARAGVVLAYVDLPTREAAAYLGVLDAAFRNAMRPGHLLVWYNRRNAWRRPVDGWHDPGVEAAIAQRADYLTSCLTPAKRAAMPESDRFEQAWSDKLVDARCDPVAALKALAAWDPAGSRPELAAMCDAGLAASIRSGQIVQIVAEIKAGLVAEAKATQSGKEA